MKTLLLAAALFFSTSAMAVELKWHEGDLLGYPALFDKDGTRIGDGEFQQRAYGNKLEVHSVYRFKDGRRANETAEFEVRPQLAQKKWSFEEHRGDILLRRYSIDFTTGIALAEKHDGAKVTKKQSHFKIKDGETFAGLGFVFAAKNLEPRLREGEKINLTAIAFSPTPRSVTVSLHKDGEETLSSGTASITGERIVIHPELPAIARVFVHPPDAVMWFAKRSPPQFLRSEATLAEPEEALLQINLFGGSSRIGRKAAQEPRP
jgi:hypothetical protein